MCSLSIKLYNIEICPFSMSIEIHICFPKVFLRIRKWTFFLSISEFTEKLLGENKRFFDETIMNFYRLEAIHDFLIRDDNFFSGK